MVMQGIASTNNQFLEALRRGDAAGCAAVYADDGIILPPNSPMLRGRAAIQEFWQGVINIGVRDATLQTVELEDKGDTAVEMGAYTLDIQPQGGQSMKDTGKYLMVWKRQADGLWKWGWDIFNSDLPPA